MPDKIRRLANEIDFKRRQLELKGLVGVANAGRSILQATLNRYREGDELHQLEFLEQPFDEITQLLTLGGVQSHLHGIIFARDKHTVLSRATDAKERAVEFLRQRASLSYEELLKVRRAYQASAVKMVEGIKSSLEDRLQDTMISLAENNATLQQGEAALRRAFQAEGITPMADYQLATMYRTQVQLATSAGRLQTLREGDSWDRLWGFEYVTMRDDRVRPAHAAMDGVRRPKNDPVWSIWTPPCGWNCRCVLVEIWEMDIKPTRKLPNVRPDVGFEFNPADLLEDMESA